MALTSHLSAARSLRLQFPSNRMKLVWETKAGCDCFFPATLQDEHHNQVETEQSSEITNRGDVYVISQQTPEFPGYDERVFILAARNNCSL